MLEWTGERFLPWIEEATIAYEHLHRYAYASTLVRNKRVLDLACGEGYGTKMLATTASDVVGIDIDETVIRHASEKYIAANLRFVKGSISAIPIEDDHVFDVVVCFEAIEHIEDHEALLREVKRLLTPNGIFIVSTPNKPVYRDRSTEENPFHVRELYFEELQEILGRHFHATKFLGQNIHPGSSIWPVGTTIATSFQEFIVERGNTAFEFIQNDKRVPLYFIAIASNADTLMTAPSSVLLDESDMLFAEKERARQEWEDQVHARDETIVSLEEALKWRQDQMRELNEGLEWAQGRVSEMEKTISSQREALSWRAVQVSELETAKQYWEREVAARTDELADAKARLENATKAIALIQASRSWKLLTKFRTIGGRLGLLNKSNDADIQGRTP